jgi:peptidyl-prolyl cis-trans isomerase B (cyclophilin B)
MKKILIIMLGFMIVSQGVIAEKKKKKEKETVVMMKTTKGDMVLKLYNETPQHRDNFLRLVREDVYDSLLFHRVIQNFMIQGGDPESKKAVAGSMLGNGEVKGIERIPAEFNPALYHKKGALAAARDGNPAKASSNCQFYIVQGKTFTDADLDRMENRTAADFERTKSGAGFKYTPEQREMYKTVGGTPHLDNNYTVFGELISGMEVMESIAAVPVDANNRPKEDVRILDVQVLKKYKEKKKKK